jgi:hypothetical protein
MSTVYHAWSYEPDGWKYVGRFDGAVSAIGTLNVSTRATWSYLLAREEAGPAGARGGDSRGYRYTPWAVRQGQWVQLDESLPEWFAAGEVSQAAASGAQQFMLRRDP